MRRVTVTDMSGKGERVAGLTTAAPENQRDELVWRQMVCSPGSWVLKVKRPDPS